MHTSDEFDETAMAIYRSWNCQDVMRDFDYLRDILPSLSMILTIGHYHLRLIDFL